MVLKNIAIRRGWNKKRSKLKARILRGASIDSEQLKKYNLYDWYKKNKISKQQSPSSSNGFIIPRDSIEFRIPTNFSLIEDHDKSFDFLNKIDTLLNGNKPLNLTILHTNTKNIDLAASFLFDEKIRKYKEKWAKLKYRIVSSGEVSHTNRNVNNFLLSFGLLKLLNINPDQFGSNFFDKDYLDKYETHKFYGNSVETHLLSQAASGLADYFNKCLRHNNYQMSNVTYLNLIGAISEIIGNAEEHASADRVDWVTLGCYDKSDHECSFAIINYGKSFYQSLKESKYTTATAITEVQTLVANNKNFFQRQLEKFKKVSEEPFWNIMALQDGISSKRTDQKTGKASTRGQGLMDFLQFIEGIGVKDTSKVSFISGKSKLFIDFSYPIHYVQIGANEKRRRIVFNKFNKLLGEQDSDKVISLEESFPGTIISGKFTINEKYLDSIK